jgi:glutathione S-transferase
MRRLIHILMSPACRLARLALGEKRISCELVPADDPLKHLPVFIDEDGTMATGLWAIVDHLETIESDHPLLPEDPFERAEALRLLDWAMTHFHDSVTRRIVFEKAAQAQTGSLTRRPPDMETVRAGRETLRGVLASLGPLVDGRGFLAGRVVSLADLAMIAHLSALDYYGEIPWADHPQVMEWYARIKSRPCFRTLLADRVPGQPPVPHYGELDF